LIPRPVETWLTSDPRLRLHRGHFVRKPITPVIENTKATQMSIHALPAVFFENALNKRLAANNAIAQNNERP
jgi:hypothetical protein